MAFITAGMGGGTGTGGAPIIAKICKDLGILTVGIVSTPYSYEGKRRQQHAEEGIKKMKANVDTLLIVSNDKLRHLFGNLKISEAFQKADNVLATAAKCITEIINSRGWVNVDFADVSTIMRNGGVAILGNAAVGGENRAQLAVEQALNSPLLNDNNIKGAKGILLNIAAPDGEFGLTMDEQTLISDYIVSLTGDDSNFILGLATNNDLGDKISVTIIATGFQHAEDFQLEYPKKEEKPQEKILMPLMSQEPETKVEKIVAVEEKLTSYLEPTLVVTPAPIFDSRPIPEVENGEVNGRITMTLNDMEETKPVQASASSEVEMLGQTRMVESRNMGADMAREKMTNRPVQSTIEFVPHEEEKSTASRGYLSRPDNIYASPASPSLQPRENVSAPIQHAEEEPMMFKMELIEKPDDGLYIPQARVEASAEEKQKVNEPSDERQNGDAEAEEPMRKSRVTTLRNLSYNLHDAEMNAEIDSVPAYVRKNMELWNHSNALETHYSKYEVRGNGKAAGEISTLNTFLDGKKPD